VGLLTALLGFGIMAGFLFSDTNEEEDSNSPSPEEDGANNGSFPVAPETDPTVEPVSGESNPELIHLEQSLLKNAQNEIVLPDENSHSLYVNTPLHPEEGGVWNVHNFNGIEGEIILEANSLNTHVDTGASYIPSVQIIENIEEQYTDVVLKSLDTHDDEWVQTIRLHGNVGISEDSILVAEQGQLAADYDGDFSELKEFRSLSSEFPKDVSHTNLFGSNQADVQQDMQLTDSRFFANDGDDEIQTSALNSSIFGGDGDDAIEVFSSSENGGGNVIFGGAGNDTITTNVDTIIDGGEGHDEIKIVIGKEDLHDGTIPANINFNYQEDALEINFPPDLDGSLSVLFDGPHFSGNGSTIRFDVSVYYSGEDAEALTKVVTLAPHYIENPLTDGQSELSLENSIESYQSKVIASIQTNLQKITI